MTQLLEKALSEVAKLPASEQDAVAARVLEALASEAATPGPVLPGEEGRFLKFC